VRCFTIAGKGEVNEVELPTTLLQSCGVTDGTGEGETKKVKAWSIVKEGWSEGKGTPGYFSLNAVTLDEGQEGLDLREWHENGWVGYVDSLDDYGKPERGGKPHRCGMY